MKRQYDKQEITRILDKFMTGETSLEEEKMLAQYFRTHAVGDEWQKYKEMFALFDNGEVDIEAGDASNQSFDEDNGKIMMLPKAVNEKPKIIPIWWLTAGIAASVLLLLALHYKGNDVKPEAQSMVAQHTEQQDSTIKVEEIHQIQEAPVVALSTPVKRKRKTKKTTTVSTSGPKVSSSVPQTYIVQTVKMVVDDPAEQMESEFKAQTASVRQRGEQVMLNVASLSQQEIDNYQMIEFYKTARNMKQIIITAMLLTCMLNASAQEQTRLDNMFNELTPLIQKGITTTRGNYGKGQTTTISQVRIGFNEYCSKNICGEDGEFFSDSIWNEFTSNKVTHKTNDHILNIVRHHLDSIMPMAEECYHFESHNQGIDTIRYSICLHSGKNQTKRHDSKQGNYSYNDVPGTETVSFSYDSKLKRCGRHFQGEGLLKYSRTESVPNRETAKKSISFEWAEYMQTVTPLLSQQGVTQRKFHWLLDSFIEDADKEYIFGTTVYLGDGKHSVKGETNGTMYFIPRDQKALADSLLKQVDFTTQNYIYQHPEQMYVYWFNPQFHSINPPQEYQYHELLRTWANESNPYNHFLIVCSDVRGYYFVVCETRGAMWFPREWGVLKSFVNGKKTYIKGMK